MSYKRLITGPFFGEFGWHLLMWSGHVRKLSHNYNEIIVACRPGEEIIYKDFATGFLLVNIDGPTDCENCLGRTWNHIVRPYVKPEDDFFPVQRFPISFDYNDERYINWKRDTEFIKYGIQSNDPNYNYDLIIHARSTNKCGTGFRNWKLENWIAVAEYFTSRQYKVACIGKEGSSAYIPGTVNKMNISLEDLANVFANSKLLIGSSSGPIHFGALCGIRHLVIIPVKIDGNVERFKAWNPLNTPHKIIGNYDWNPPLDYVINAIEEDLK